MKQYFEDIRQILERARQKAYSATNFEMVEDIGAIQQTVSVKLNWSQIARNPVLPKNKQLFASKYLPYLPSEEEQAAEIEREKQISRQN